jgi:hypothetical protein
VQEAGLLADASNATLHDTTGREKPRGVVTGW